MSRAHLLDGLARASNPFVHRPGRREENWETSFQAHPDIQVTLTTRAQSDDEIWGEWEFKADNGDGSPAFWQRGVIIVVVGSEVIVQSRFYMEPVEAPND